MYKSAKILFKKVITPMHVGSGNDLGVIDLPIQREKHTGFPKIEGSSLKGSLREAYEAKLGAANLDVHLAFGYDDDADDNEKSVAQELDRKTQYAGALGFSDARLLLLPVRSVKGVFAYATCPMILNRLVEENAFWGSEGAPDISGIAVTEGSVLFIRGSKVVNDQSEIKTVSLEEYTFKATECDDKAVADFFRDLGILLEEDILRRLVILSDDDFNYFSENGTEVITRTKIDNETGTVKGTALFNEEYLPAGSFLYSLVFVAPVFNGQKGSFPDETKLQNWFLENSPEYLQIGANATIGKGICKLAFQGGKK